MGEGMTWLRVDKYAIRRGNQSIAKVYVDGCTLYELWNGDAYGGHFNDADEAKAEAESWAKARDEGKK